MRYLSSKDLADLIPAPTLVAALEEGLRDFAVGKVLVPARQHVKFGDNTLLTMPAITGTAFGVKIVSVMPLNAKRAKPVVSGLMMICDGANGVPVGILDATTLTAQRTGAVGALGLKYTTPLDVERIGVIGTGLQGTWQAIFARAVRPIKTVYFVDRSDESAQRFTDTVSRHAPTLRLVRCGDVIELLSKTEVVIAATTSSTPVLPAQRELLQDKHFLSIGSFKPSMQELPGTVYELAKQVVVDAEAAKTEAGDLVQPLASGLLREENLIHLADLVIGARHVDTTRTTVFKSVGMALYDLYAARAFLEEAEHVGRGNHLEA